MNKRTAKFLTNLYNQTVGKTTLTEMQVMSSIRTSTKPYQVEIDRTPISAPITAAQEVYGLTVIRKH